MSRELGDYATSEGQILLELPESFQVIYPKVQCTIYCTECLTETASALDIQAALWADYKHHSMIKFLLLSFEIGVRALFHRVMEAG